MNDVIRSMLKGGRAIKITVIVCHEVPEIEITIHLGHMQLVVVLRTTRCGDLHGQVK